MTIIRSTVHSAFALLGGLSLLIAGCEQQSATPPMKATAPTASSAPATAKIDEWKPWQAGDLEADDFQTEAGFRTLGFSDFESFFAKPPKPDVTATWQQVGPAIVCTGKPKGYLYSKEQFRDFTLRLELRFAPPSETAGATEFNPNSGVMIYITEPHKQWPKSLEVQGKFAELATIKENGGAAKVEIHDDAMARESSRKPASEWNSVEIVSKGGALSALLNGTKVCESQPSDVSEGAIGLQSEDFEVHFRRLRIRAE